MEKRLSFTISALADHSSACIEAYVSFTEFEKSSTALSTPSSLSGINRIVVPMHFVY